MKKIYSILLAAFVCLAVTSCVEDEIYPYASVKSLTNTVAYSEVDDVTVTVKASALVDLTGATLFYNVAGGEFTAVSMTGSNGTYTGIIPAGVAQIDQEVTYYVEVESASGKTTKSAINKYVVGQVPVDYTGLVLNELNGNDKFIELYNGGDHDIYIAGVQMFKDGGADAKWTGPKVNLKKGEYMVLWSADLLRDDIDASLIFNSGLSAKKAVRITLQSPAGEIIDDFNTSNSTAWGGSFGRNADGKWYYQSEKTPGSKNVDGADPMPMI